MKTQFVTSAQVEARGCMKCGAKPGEPCKGDDITEAHPHHRERVMPALITKIVDDEVPDESGN